MSVIVAVPLAVGLVVAVLLALLVGGRRDRGAVGSAVTERERLVAEREARLEAREQRLEELDRRLAAQTETLSEALAAASRQAQAAEQSAERQRLAEQRAAAERTAELERLAGMTAEAARAELLAEVTASTRRDAAVMIRDIESSARAEGEERARDIVVQAVQRVATEQTTESVVSAVALPAEEMKGRIIGREGRNIRTFEAVTGVNLLIDDAPDAVLLSCFDPVRREVGRLTLEALVRDGRIQPQRIEDAYQQACVEVGVLCSRAAEESLAEVGITDLHPVLVEHLGRLRFRTSYGQNVLRHLVETSQLAGVMASELGLNVALVRRCAFLHDIGKALTAEVEGSHALIGADLARRFGESEEVVHAIAAHHNEVAPQTAEAVLTIASDSCSGGRPGARRESMEVYVHRLRRIEEIAGTRPGVERVYAMQAGREVRVMVQPEQVDDVAAHLLAREIAQQIQSELTYPGQIRVTVVRESRAIEVAR